MSTKRLDKTVIEGGRYNHNKWERRNSHAEFRARDKNYLSELKSDPENWYDYDVESNKTVYKDFKDKLNPMYRWLHAQVGRVWNDVRSEITQKFDTRTTAGRHIVFDHLLSNVEEIPNLNYRRYSYQPEDWTTSYYKNDFYVDESGILQSKKFISRKRKAPKFDGKKIAKWLNGCVVGFVGDKLFWFTPVGKNKKYNGQYYKWTTTWGTIKHSYYQNSPLQYHYLGQEIIYKEDKDGKIVLNENGSPVIEGYQDKWINATPIFKQDRKLTDKEIVFWNSIPEFYQKIVLKHSPTYVETEQDKIDRQRYL